MQKPDDGSPACRNLQTFTETPNSSEHLQGALRVLSSARREPPWPKRAQAFMFVMDTKQKSSDWLGKDKWVGLQVHFITPDSSGSIQSDDSTLIQISDSSDFGLSVKLCRLDKEAWFKSKRLLKFIFKERCHRLGLKAKLQCLFSLINVPLNVYLIAEPWCLGQFSFMSFETLHGHF